MSVNIYYPVTLCPSEGLGIQHKQQLHTARQMPRLLGLHAQGASSLDSSLGVAHGKYKLSAERRKYDSIGRRGEEGKRENALLWGRGGILFHIFFTSRARLTGATVPSPETTPGIPVLFRMTDSPIST